MLWHQEIHYLIQGIPPLVRTLSQTSPVLFLLVLRLTYLLYIHFILFSPLYLGPTSCLLLQDSSTKLCIPLRIFASFLSCHLPPLQFVLLNISTHLCCTGKESYSVLIL